MIRRYSLHKARNNLYWTYSWLQKKKKLLTEPQKTQLEVDLRKLEAAIASKDVTEANRLSEKVKAFTSTRFKRTYTAYGFEIVIAIILAFTIAIVIRQMWFELYEIPTGSMRPSFREQDHLTVSKTQFGLNVPLATEHFYFDPNLVQRAKVIIFSGDNIPLPDTDSPYFGIIPYKKRYVKRMIGKPGDTLYFYGGFIYGVDKDDKPIDVLLDDPWMKKIEHIPFLSFEGEVSSPASHQIVFKQMNMPLARLTFSGPDTMRGEIFNEKKWVKDSGFASNEKSDNIQTYGDFWGFDNFAMARLLTKEQVNEYTNFNTANMEEGVLYLELRHSPNLTYPPPRIYRESNRIAIQLPTYESLIPLKQHHVDAIMDNMYTGRFVIKNGIARRYDADNRRQREGNPAFFSVPDGTYDFFYGKADKVGFGGWSSLVPSNSPLYLRTPERVQILFNMGVNNFVPLEPSSLFQAYYPNRYAYFRDGDLYLMGAPILKKDDPTLVKFLESEMAKQKEGTTQKPYRAFIDRGPPMKEGKLDIAFIKSHGVKVPEKGYLVLGDNHAMSGDSRIFGFVPQANLQGVPRFIIWPPGNRWGDPPQTPYPVLTLPRLIVWSIVLVILAGWYAWHRHRMSRRLFIE